MTDLEKRLVEFAKEAQLYFVNRPGNWENQMLELAEKLLEESKKRNCEDKTA